MRSRSLRPIILFLLCVMGSHAATDRTPYYQVRVLDIFEQFYVRVGLLMNERGEIASLVGTNEDGFINSLLILSEGQTNFIPVPPLNYTSHSLMGFNVLGEAVITADYTALLYRGGEMINLSNLVDATYFTRVAINDRGMIVGGAQSADGGAAFAFRHDRGRQTIFPTFVSDSHALASAVNKRGRVVGGAQVLSNALEVFDFYHAAVFQRARLRDLGTLQQGSLSMATGLNDRGDIIGFSTTTNDSTQAFLYTGGRMRRLPALPGDARSEAIDINNKRQIVGHSSDGDPEFRPRGQLFISRGQCMN